MTAPTPELLIDGPDPAKTTLVLAHGAGAAMDSAFMDSIAGGAAAHGLRVVRFEFPYMAERRRTGKKKPPNRLPVLQQTWLDVIERLRQDGLVRDRLYIGGKSMGGRIASLIADESQVAGLVCLGYPFHPAGKPDRLRIEHLQHLATPALILQGERDPLGTRQEIAEYPLSPNIRIHYLPDGDHSFKPRKKSGLSEEENLQQAVEKLLEFVQED